MPFKKCCAERGHDEEALVLTTYGSESITTSKDIEFNDMVPVKVEVQNQEEEQLLEQMATMRAETLKGSSVSEEADDGKGFMNID